MHSTYFCFYFYILLHISSESLILLTYFRIFCFKTELWWIQQLWLDNALDHRECSLLDVQHLHSTCIVLTKILPTIFSSKPRNFQIFQEVFEFRVCVKRLGVFQLKLWWKTLYFIRMKCNTTDIYQYICVCNVFTCTRNYYVFFPYIQTRKASVCAIKSFSAMLMIPNISIHKLFQETPTN